MNPLTLEIQDFNFYIDVEQFILYYILAKCYREHFHSFMFMYYVF